MAFITMLLGLLSKLPSTAINIFTGINFSSIFANIAKYWYFYTIGVLIAVNLFFSYEWHHTSDLLTKEKAVHAQDIQNFKTAQDIANANAKAEQAALVKESKADAAQADANYSGLLFKYHASLVRYSTSQGASQQADHYQLPTPQGSDGPGSSTDLPKSITITGNDAEICAINTARLQAVHDWAIALPKEASQ